jgi:hypothetical protein
MRKEDSFEEAVVRFVGRTSRRLRSLEAGAADLQKRLEDVQTDGEDLGERVAAGERQAVDLEDLGERLRLGLIAVLSHAIRRQHLPQGFTFDSELWNRLRDLGGEEACAAVTVEIERSQAVLRRAEVSRETDQGTVPQPENDRTICD